MSKDDQDWLDALAGRPGAGADPDTMRRAALLRQAMRAQRAAEAYAASPEGLDRLLFRLRREGLLEKDRRGQGFPAMFAMAATVLLVLGLGWVVVFGNKQSNRDVVSTLPAHTPAQRPAQAPEAAPEVAQVTHNTHGPSGPQIMQAAVPDDLASDLMLDFASAGIALTQRSGGAEARLDADLPDTISPNALRVFERYNLAVPADRKLIIVIRQPAAEQ